MVSPMLEQHFHLDYGFSMTVLRCISVLGSFYLQNENTVYRLEILYYIVATIYIAQNNSLKLF